MPARLLVIYWMFLKIIHGYVKLIVLWTMCRFTVVEGGLKKFTIPEGRCGFYCSGSMQRRIEGPYFSIVYVLEIVSKILWNSWRNSLFALVYAIPIS